MLYASCGVRQEHDYLHHPRFLTFRLGCRQIRNNRQQGKKKKIDFRMKSYFLTPMTVIPSDPPNHTPRALIVRVNVVDDGLQTE